MVFLWPSALLGFIAVAVVAAWVLFRPGRYLVAVGSLELWHQALNSLDRSARRKSRRVTLSWLCLLMGASAAVLSAGRPVHYSDVPSRIVSVGYWPCAEISNGEDPAAGRKSVHAFLERLDAHDRVELLLPAILGGASELMTPGEAIARIESLPILAASSGELPLPPPSNRTQHVYYFAPSWREVIAGPNVNTVRIPASLPPATIDAIGAEETAGGKVQIFVAIKNQTAAQVQVQLVQQSIADDGKISDPKVGPVLAIPPAGRWEGMMDGAPAAGLSVGILAQGKKFSGLGAEAFLIRRPAGKTTVAMIGPDCPQIRRFIRINPALELVADAKDAQVVVANVDEPPVRGPSLVINPSRIPAGFSRGEELENILLSAADVVAGNAIMQNVDFSGVAVRRMTTWKASEEISPSLKTIASYKGGAFMLQDGSQGGLGADAQVRRIYVAFNMDSENTNFSLTPGFVIFLANAFQFLAPNLSSGVQYECLAPLKAGMMRDWKAVFPRGDSSADSSKAILPQPGIYKDSAGILHAVSLIGLAGGEVPQDPVIAAGQVPLTEKRRSQAGVELWVALLAAAVMFWLVGWALRVR